MTFRARIALIAAAAVAVAVVAASVGIYFAAANVLRGEVDESLRQIATDLARPSFGSRAGRFGGPGGFVQVIDGRGNVEAPFGDDRPLPVSQRAMDVADGGQSLYETVTVDGQSVRVLTLPLPRGLAVQIARPLTEVQASLQRLRRQLVVGSLLGIGLAAALGMAVARRAVRPVDRLTDLAEDVAATRDLSRRIEVTGEDEIGRLARTFNRMLGELEQARDSQQQLVADASHELRTPLTSLRTNIEVLTDVERLSTRERDALIGDVIAQLDEFGGLVAGLVELARGDRPATATTTLDLAEVVDTVVARARTFAPDGRDITLAAAPTLVQGEADRVERAVANLVDNALKYGADGAVEVRVAEGSVAVRDHGPGIADEDLPHVFDRFYRAPDARGEPGSGLGLAIVKQVADSHGGSVRIERPDDGGTRVTLTLPGATA